MASMYLVYINVKGLMAVYELTNVKYSCDYIQGYCPTENGFRIFHKNRIISYLNSLEHAVNYLNSVVLTLKLNRDDWINKYQDDYIRKYKLNDVFEVYFIGFKNADKERLKHAAISAGMIVHCHITTNIHILCCGYNVEPKKMETAILKGIMVLTENEFIDLLNSGVIPDKYIP
ncbi:hypothetical protein DNW15_11920 [Salmonella enterica subsp. enterica]|nr:hypothetical protein [Salmonella enterica subsp. enterica]EHV9882925.1 hypothetical protein [Salmonella enterica subsp. enterica serovar Durham]EHW1156268.1 hypothetical protein [Salmonella enterica subsp. enterica serovar Takoradi]ECK8872685.1 hypothetical protein [Salmonella enterica subsp. enterica]EDU0378418.1 hypothetical protein [Salmonella enterica subsp. enterica]